jgi:Tfp pilus assembly protein PilO
MAAISGRERTLIGVAVVLAVLIAGWVFAIEPLRERNRELAELVPAREHVLAKRRDLIARGPALTRELEEATQRVERLKTRLLAAATPPVAASELVKIVKDAAQQAGLQVRSERILAPAARAELLEIPAEITVSGGIREIVALLYHLEDTRKILTFQDLKIRVLNVSQPKELLATVTVSGFILAKPPASKAA